MPMDLDTLRDSCRTKVHETFGIPAVYTPPGDGATPVNLTKARLHRNMVRQGDLDREGYAQVVEDVNRVVFDSDEIVPVAKAVVDFGRGRRFRLVRSNVADGDRYHTWEVAPV